jgi:hypothetical protein
MSTAFVICQVGPEDSDVRKRADEIFDYIVEPVVQGRGLLAARSDRDPTPGQVTSQIIQSLTGASVIIADLTGRNPNVYYELGVAHSFGKPVVILVDTADSLSFDTSQGRVIEIGKGDRLAVAEAEKAKAKLGEALDVVLEEGYRPSSLVSDAAGTQSLDALAPDNPIAQELAHVRERLELVVKQTATSAQTTSEREYVTLARQLFEVLRELGRSGALTTHDLMLAGIDPGRMTKNLSINAQLKDVIGPRTPPTDIPVDTSDFGVDQRQVLPADDVPF